jgi:hypothetical protein
MAGALLDALAYRFDRRASTQRATNDCAKRRIERSRADSRSDTDRPLH